MESMLEMSRSCRMLESTHAMAWWCTLRRWIFNWLPYCILVTILQDIWTAIFSNYQSLTGIKGLSEAKVDKICEAVEKIVVSISVSILIVTNVYIKLWRILMSIFLPHSQLQYRTLVIWLAVMHCWKWASSSSVLQLLSLLCTLIVA